MLTSPVRLLVCGSRDWGVTCDHSHAEPKQAASCPDRLGSISYLEGILDKVNSLVRLECVINGGARGADRLARLWAARNDIAVHTYFADWDKHGPAAGPIRNQRMLEEAKPTLGVGFSLGGDVITPGTKDMIERLHGAQIPCQVCMESGLVIRYHWPEELRSVF